MIAFKVLLFLLFFFYAILNVIFCANTGNAPESGTIKPGCCSGPKILSIQGRKIVNQSNKEAYSKHYRDQSPHTRLVSNQATAAREAIQAQALHRARKEDATYRIKELTTRSKKNQFNRATMQIEKDSLSSQIVKGAKNVPAQMGRKAKAIVSEKLARQKEKNVISDTDFHVAKGSLTHEDRQNIHEQIRQGRAVHL